MTLRLRRRRLICGLLFASGLYGQATDANHVKAAFLYNFARFVTWPAGTFRDDREPFDICVLGQEDAFQSAIEETVGQKTVGGRYLRILRIADAGEAAACQIVFIGSSERKRLRPVMKALPPAGILTMADMDDFATTGGVVRFVVKDGHMAFQISRRAAEKANLQISSRLLSLAELVQ